MKKYLNIGCGRRFFLDDNWLNVDFNVKNMRGGVKQVNLLKPLPFEDDYFDFIYCSHVLEHFTVEDAEALLQQIFRVLSPSGVFRVVVPDMEKLCRQYLQSLDAHSNSPDRHQWFMIELIDQLVRTKAGGRKRSYLENTTPDSELSIWLLSFIGKEMRDLIEKFDRQEKRTRKTQLKKIILKLIPQIFLDLRFQKSGELHKWMYDRITLPDMLINNGASDVVLQEYNHTTTNVSLDGLDIDQGREYKPFSLYIEARKK